MCRLPRRLLPSARFARSRAQPPEEHSACDWPLARRPNDEGARGGGRAEPPKLGNPVRIVLTPGQAHEMTVARELLAPIHDAYVTADSAYSSASLIKELEQRGCEAVVANNPTHRRRNLDAHLYRERFLVEAFFQKLKRYRRVAMRFEKLAKDFLACVQLAMRSPRVRAPLAGVIIGSARPPAASVRARGARSRARLPPEHSGRGEPPTLRHLRGGGDERARRRRERHLPFRREPTS